MTNEGLLVEIKIKRADGTVLMYAEVSAFSNYDVNLPPLSCIVTDSVKFLGFEYKPKMAARSAMSSLLDRARGMF